MDRETQDRLSNWAQAAITTSTLDRIAQQQADLARLPRRDAADEMIRSLAWISYFDALKRSMDVGAELLQAGHDAGVFKEAVGARADA
jgi:hypothetical protein